MNWTKMKDDYVNSNISLRALAKANGVAYATVQRRATAENWQAQRIYGDSVSPDIRRALDDLSRRLLAAIERAASELDHREVVTKTKVKTEDGEVNTERHYFEPGGSINCKDLKVLTAAVKDIRDIQMVRPPLDIREQEAKIRNLERQFTQAGDTSVTVTLDGQTEEFAQ